MTTTLGIEIRLPVAFEEALRRTREALAAQGFGILTEIDLRKAFKEKLGRDFRPYVILGACNPPLAFAAVTADPAVGILLPCNVAIEAVDDDYSIVRLTDPEALLASAFNGNSLALRDVARDAGKRIQRVAESLGG